ncbi:uncharacterized protein LOC124293039 [Neodiprion lecontei]|uniref:Uncharacterized protein LOC124293039 n=1 Tax=Neodiprion lecontei TaxID=441921 RepID=A0ABM3FIR7_NEOLC|nr:uncharacterized protein LOC124293039 [Neodiprion lecontei]
MKHQSFILHEALLMIQLAVPPELGVSRPPPVRDGKIIVEGSETQVISSTKLPRGISTESGGTRESYNRQTGTSQTGEKIAQAMLTDTHGVNGRQISTWQHHQRGTRSLFRIIPQHHVRKKRRTPLHLRRNLAERNFINTGSVSHERQTACERCTTTETALYHRTRVKKRNNDSPPLNNDRFARRNDPEYEEDTHVDKEETENDMSDWDEWTEWSECSTSCGCGRQVRWRHCIGKECMAGLKKAQIRTCHLRDCNSKSLLTWLGIKA